MEGRVAGRFIHGALAGIAAIAMLVGPVVGPAFAAGVTDAKPIDHAPVIVLESGNGGEHTVDSTKPADSAESEDSVGNVETPGEEGESPTPVSPVPQENQRESAPEMDPTATEAPSSQAPAEDSAPSTVLDHLPVIAVERPVIEHYAYDGELLAEDVIRLAGASVSDGYAIRADAAALEALDAAYRDYADADVDVALTVTKDGVPVEGAAEAVVRVVVRAPGSPMPIIERHEVTLDAVEGAVSEDALLTAAGARPGVPDATVGIDRDQVDEVNRVIADNAAGPVQIAVKGARFGITRAEFITVNVTPVAFDPHGFDWRIADGQLTEEVVVERSGVRSPGRGYRFDVHIDRLRAANDRIQQGRDGSIDLEMTAYRPDGSGAPYVTRTVKVRLVAEETAIVDALPTTGVAVMGPFAAMIAFAGLGATLMLYARRREKGVRRR
ncbi:hypothetical protein [Bifidobacterium vespertilionis]|uniref:hypothetical protein n=1 Tax=Bifidobacterium vespertilionis TaxID=2562524 RepID=UPI001BDD3EFB|nr:hypothetical protein [Bifidobacterium vespertilionis]MBT1179167.1 hypothetical protein [Bifidobacterium vespertilionis]